jgi:thymidine phosphorylase
MSLEEQIIKQVHELPESKQSEVLDFVEYLRTKTDEKDWSAFTLSSAMRGMEEEESLYTLDDLKESSS